jgi:hypothetical protein
VNPPATLAATFAKVERLVALYLQADGKQFQRLLQTNNLRIYKVMYSSNFIFISKLLRDL